MTYRPLFFFFMCLSALPASLLAAEPDQSLAKEMKEYKKHCVILVNLANTYGLLDGNKNNNELPEGITKEKDRYGRVVYYDEDGEEISESDVKKLTEEQNISVIDSETNPALIKFYALKDTPSVAPYLSRLERSFLKQMGTNCASLIESIEQYNIDSISLKGKWKTFSENSKTTMNALRKAFISRLKEYRNLVET